MNPGQLQQMTLWLRKQIVNMCEFINEAHHAKDYVKKAQYEGMRDAYTRCLNKMNALTIADAVVQEEKNWIS